MDKSEAIASGSGDLERLTENIRAAVASFERRDPHCFHYNGISLRGAVERRLYEEAAVRPASLAVLCEAGSPREDFSNWLPNRSSTTGRDRLGPLKAWSRLMFYGLWRASNLSRDEPKSNREGSGQLDSNTPSTNRAEIVFFALRPRFVSFFRPVINRLGSDRCALLCESGYGVEQEALRNHFAVCEKRSARLQVQAVRRPPQALFPLYAAAIVDLLRALGTLRRFRPRVVVFAEAASSSEEVVARAARSLGIATVRVQYGRAGVLSPGYYEMPYDKILMWGQGFVDRIKPASPDACYVVTGSPLLDTLSHQEDSQPLNEFANDCVLMTVITQPECNNISRDDYETLVLVVERVLNATSNLKVLVRLHPADRATDFRRLAAGWGGRLRVTNIEDYPLGALLAKSTLVAGLYSTVLSEAVAYGVLPVVIRLGDRHRIFPSPEEAGAAALATSADEAVTEICRLADNPAERDRYRPAMQSFAQHYFGPTDGGALERIAKHIGDLAH